MCSFWLVSALVEIGETDRAEELLDLLTRASPLGLYAEQLDPASGRLLGNIPKAFSHLALINAVLHVIRAHEGRDVGTSDAAKTRRSRAFDHADRRATGAP
jgi:alpha,alpha-trehalase